MISSRRISKLHNQFVTLLRRTNVNNRQYTFGSNIAREIEGTKNLAKTYPWIEKQRRHVSTSARLLAQTETMKGEGDHGLNLNYEDILKSQKDESVLIIDVREDAEIKETGKLPGSIHVPMGDVANVLTNLSAEAFLEKFQRPKPTKDTKMILSCRSGRRSATVQEELLKLGYQKSYNYTGGWLDWESKQTPAV